MCIKGTFNHAWHDLRGWLGIINQIQISAVWLLERTRKPFIRLPFKWSESPDMTFVVDWALKIKYLSRPFHRFKGRETSDLDKLWFHLSCFNVNAPQKCHIFLRFMSFVYRLNKENQLAEKDAKLQILINCDFILWVALAFTLRRCHHSSILFVRQPLWYVERISQPQFMPPIIICKWQSFAARSMERRKTDGIAK